MSAKRTLPLRDHFSKRNANESCRLDVILRTYTRIVRKRDRVLFDVRTVNSVFGRRRRLPVKITIPVGSELGRRTGRGGREYF